MRQGMGSSDMEEGAPKGKYDLKPKKGPVWHLGKCACSHSCWTWKWYQVNYFFHLNPWLAKIGGGKRDSHQTSFHLSSHICTSALWRLYTETQKNRGWQPSHTCYAWRLSIKFSTHRIGVIWRDRGSKMVSDETTEAENKRWKHETNLEGRNDG